MNGRRVNLRAPEGSNCGDRRFAEDRICAPRGLYDTRRVFGVFDKRTLNRAIRRGADPSWATIRRGKTNYRTTKTRSRAQFHLQSVIPLHEFRKSTRGKCNAADLGLSPTALSTKGTRHPRLSLGDVQNCGSASASGSLRRITRENVFPVDRGDGKYSGEENFRGPTPGTPTTIAPRVESLRSGAAPRKIESQTVGHGLRASIIENAILKHKPRGWAALDDHHKWYTLGNMYRSLST